MTETTTIERKTVAMPRRPRSLTHKMSMRRLLPIGDYVTDGAISIKTDCFPEGGKREKWFKWYLHSDDRDTARNAVNRMCPEMIASLPRDTGLPAFTAKRLFLDIDGETLKTVIVTDSDTPEHGFDVRYWLFVEKCGFAIHPRGDEQGGELTAAPYPIRDKGGDIVGLIMPVRIKTRQRRDLIVDIA